MPKKWKCTVCGYLHEGPEPPDNCPRCGADRSQFIPLEEEKVNLLQDLWETFVLHAVASHFPNGLLPTALVLFLLGVFLPGTGLEEAVFYLILATLAVIPVSLASGIYDWQTKFRGVKATIFYKKIALGVLLLVLGVVAAGLRFLHPDLVEEGGVLGKVYGGLLGGMVLVSILLGHYGGKLVFQWKNRQF